MELDVYESHPFLVGEIAEEQRGGYFSFVRGAGVEGYKLGVESVTITIPARSDKLDRNYFCNSCRELLADYEKDGYILVDLKNTEQPVIYRIDDGTAFSLRCYEVAVQKLDEASEYEISVVGTYMTDGKREK